LTGTENELANAEGHFDLESDEESFFEAGNTCAVPAVPTITEWKGGCKYSNNIKILWHWYISVELQSGRITWNPTEMSSTHLRYVIEMYNNDDRFAGMRGGSKIVISNTLMDAAQTTAMNWLDLVVSLSRQG